MVRWLRWHCPPDTGFEIRALAVWGRARYLSVTEAPHNTNFHTWMGKKQFCFSQTAETGNRTPDSGVKGSGANHYPRAPALLDGDHWLETILLSDLYRGNVPSISFKLEESDVFKTITRKSSLQIIMVSSSNIIFTGLEKLNKITWAITFDFIVAASLYYYMVYHCHYWRLNGNVLAGVFFLNAYYMHEI